MDPSLEQVTIFLSDMDSDEYEIMLTFLKEGCFPKCFSRQQRWNFQKKASLYYLSESGIFFKVR